MTEVDRVRAAYDLVAASYARLLPGPTAETPIDLAVLDDFARRVRGHGPVLDAGCGSGRMSRYLQERGVQVHGVDLSPEMIRLAQEQSPDLSFAVGSIDALELPSGSQAGVLAWYSLIHTPAADLSTVIGELLRVLAPGGWLLIGCQSGSGPRHIAAAYGHDVVLTAHLHTSDRIADLVTAGGTEVHSQLTRAPEGSEKHAQARVMARQVDAPPASGPL